MDSSVFSYRVGKIFKPDAGKYRFINSLVFDDAGEYCLTATAAPDDVLTIHDVVNARQYKTVYSKKYGCNHARFTHWNSCIIHASTKCDDSIRYLSFHDNKYLRFFAGHTDRVTALEMSPQHDTFLSASMDGTVRLWDLKQPKAIGVLDIQPNAASPCIAFDQSGMVMAIALNSNSIRLYDTSNFDKGPFATFNLQSLAAQFPHSRWHAIRFSNDGAHILVSTTANHVFIIDAYEGQVKQVLSGHWNPSGIHLMAEFTNDGKHVLCGSQDGKIHIWDTQSGNQVHTLNAHYKAVTSLRFNHKYMMFASVDEENLAFWLPN